MLSTRTIAERIDVPTPTLYRWLREGRLPRPVKGLANEFLWSDEDLRAAELVAMKLRTNPTRFA